MKTKIIIAVAAVAVLVLGFLGVKYSDKFLPELNTSTADTQETTTLKPFVEAQTEIIGGVTASGEAATTKERETAKLISSSTAGWPRDELLNPLPRPDTKKISVSYEYKTAYGRQLIVRFNELSYKDFLKYIKKVEAAGFTDKNNRYHIPDDEPTGTAMFYYSFDGERSFGIYWHGEESLAGFDCEIVICDYDQAK